MAITNNDAMLFHIFRKLPERGHKPFLSLEI
ncbi:hypothetical protein L681_19695 [Stenotrophomonas maltophilia MF89]|nr:hypothetical protein L681_19695 [Stenotrophomonas maltophilia MF89]